MASTVQLLTRNLYSATPPSYQTKDDMIPTLLVSWWATGFAIVIILIRVAGRFVRTEKLFREDKIMFYSIIPLMIRMGLVHVILLWGTNNTVTSDLSAQEIRHREVGSKLVLAARIFYAMFIWIAKYSLIGFLKRLIGTSWHKTYELAMRVIDGFLALTFVAVVIATLAECHPFSHYWQVVPDPGPQCRQGIAQLITMGVCDMVTDLVLIAFPIPLVVASSMPLKRKIALTLLFLMSFILIAVTAYRVPTTIDRKAAQQYRSLLASLEILAASGVANAIVIGSFVRDRGVKKARFRAASVSMDNPLERQPTRAKSMAQHHWGSDEDLALELGMSIDPELRYHNTLSGDARPAPVAPSTGPKSRSIQDDEDIPPASLEDELASAKRRPGWHRTRDEEDVSDMASVSSASTDIKFQGFTSEASKEQGEPDTPPARKMSFFDVGGLIDSTTSPHAGASRNPSIHDQSSPSTNPTKQHSSRAFLSDIGGLLASHREENPSRLKVPAPLPGSIDRHSSTQSTKELKNFLRDASRERRPIPKVLRGKSPSPGPSSGRRYSEKEKPSIVGDGPDGLSFSDAGGLLH